VGKRTHGKVSNGIFTPVNISKNVIKGFEEITKEIQKTDPSYRNPFYDSIGAISNIRGQLFNVGLDEEEVLPEIENPFETPILPDVISNIKLPQLNTTGAFLGSQNVTLGNAGSTIPQNNLVKEKGKQVFGSTDRIFGT
jgi:hypothetical protein